MILRPLTTTQSDYNPSWILLFFPIYEIKVRAILSWIDTEFIPIIIIIIMIIRVLFHSC